MKEKSTQFSRLQNGRLMSGILAAAFAIVIFALVWVFSSHINALSVTGLAQKLACSGGIAVLLGSLLFLLADEHGRDGTEPVKQRPDWYYPLWSGILSLATMCVAYSFVGMWPLGNETGMIVDMHHQYAPLLSGLRNAILEGSLSTYSFEVGLGANYVSVFGYYLASPLNALLLLFPERFLAEGILVITLLKNALTGAFFGLCVQRISKYKGLCIPLVSVMYSMMMYLIAYSWNIMWLDVVMVLPIVVLGFEELMKNGKFGVYVFSLAYCLYANYYIGFMLCIFLVLYYAAYVLRSSRTGKAVAISLGRFAGCSLLGAGLSAVLLIPVYFALQTTSAAGGDLPDIKTNFDFFELIGRHLVATSPTIRSGNLPNLYCGVLSALCVPLFALNSGISLRKRVAYVGLWMAMGLSFVINWIDLLWHGLHSPNDLPYRFSFLYCFVVLLMAFEALRHLKHIKTKHVLSVCACAVTYLFIEERFGNDTYGVAQIYINLAVIAIYTFVLAIASKKWLCRGVAYALLLFAVTAEMIFGGGYAFVSVNQNEHYTDHVNYVDNTETQATLGAVELAQTIGDKQANGDFYRMEFLPRRTCVDTALFHYRGITTFSSSNYYTTTRLMGGLGYAINGVNSHLYKSFVPFTDSLLGIRYVVLQSDLISHPQLKKVDSYSKNGTTYYIYENTAALGLGYMSDPMIKQYSYTQYNPILSQNDLFTALTGIQESLYTLHPISSDDFNGSLSYNSSGFHVHVSEEVGTAQFSATLQSGGQLFLYAECGASESMNLSCNGNNWSVSPHEPFIIDGGECEEGTVVTFEVTAEMSCTGNLYVATLNKDLFEQGMAQLRKNQLVVSEFTDNRIQGTVSTDKSGVLMTSIPYDEGWVVKVDGVETDTVAVDKGFLAIDLTAGDHEIELQYVPRGMLIGGVISLVSLIVLVVLLIVLKHKKRPVPVPISAPNETVAVLPVQEGFVAEDVTVQSVNEIPDTLEELTASTDQPLTAQPAVAPKETVDEPINTEDTPEA